MTTRAQQARLFNQAVAQGLTEDQALAAAGITDFNLFSYGINGQLVPAVIGPPRRPNETIVPATVGIDAGDDDDDRQFGTRSVNSQSTTTSQTTVTGGSVTTRSVTPTTYTDTPASRALQGEADRLDAAKQARSAELRAQGKTGAEIIRDSEYQELSREAQGFSAAAQNQKAVNQAGTVTTTVAPGAAPPESAQTVDGNFQIQETTGEDPTVETQQANRVNTSGDTSVPQQSAADDPQAGNFVFDDNGDLIPADSGQGQEILAAQQRIENNAPAPVDATFSVVPDEQGSFGVWSNGEGRLVVQGLTEQEATLRAQEFNTVGFDTPDAAINTATRQSDLEIAAANEAATRERARVQATLANQLRQADSGDWRFKVRLAPGARYLYRGEDGQGVQSGILAPLAVTDGVIFPYTPTITQAYRARYAEQDLPHSNYRGYFYSGSNPETVNVQGTFTAQDTVEANYLLAVIHFFRSVTKMFYGQNDTNRGAPPPLVFLQGFGAYQFSRHPCVVTNFNYVLPGDVDYIRADVQPITGLNIQQGRRPGGVPPQSLPTNVFTGALGRLANAGIPKGAIFRPAAADTLGTIVPTYVPTKMDITIELLPMQTRQQVSQEFSLKDFASGKLQRKGFW